MLNVVTVPHPVLTKQSEPVKLTKSMKSFINDMIETLDSMRDRGVGLSAPQVGKLWQVILVAPRPKQRPQVLVNPVILTHQQFSDDERQSIEADRDRPLEGCLSIPRLFAPVHRYKKIHVRYTDIQGEERTDWFEGFKGVVVQHEIDHLHGILFTQRALEQGTPIYEEKNGQLVRVRYA